MNQEDLSNFSDKEIKKYSAENPGEIFTSEDGRFVFNGEIYHSKEELKRSVEVQIKLVKCINKNRFLRFLFGVKKKKKK